MKKKYETIIFLSQDSMEMYKNKKKLLTSYVTKAIDLHLIATDKSTLLYQ